MVRMKSEQNNFGIRKQNEFRDYRDLAHHIMQLAMRGLLRPDFLNEVSKLLLAFAKCDSVELWLEERGRYYACEVKLPNTHEYVFRILSEICDKNGKIVPKVRDKHLPESMLQDVILGHMDPYIGNSTKKGSFYTGGARSVFSQILKNTGIKQKSRYIHSMDFESLAIFPIRLENENIGLLQLKSKALDYFSQQDVEFYEDIVHTLGIALIHRRTQVELRERIKELTCLYGIAKLVENSALSLSQILQGIVELLPPAWLYPGIASAQIVLDGKSYATTNYQKGETKQTANIVVDGESRGIVEISYSEVKPELDEGPFLWEERSLIDTIARETALIIERKQTEEDKQRLQEQLRHADRLATIGQLSAGVAHELNEPIGSILGFAQLIQKYPSLPEQVGHDTEKIMKASLHAREVIKKLMLFARQMPPQKTRVNLNRIIDEGLYFLESRCAKEGINVKRTLLDHLPEIYADSAQMTQILVNVVVNAIQAMPEGGELTIQTTASKKSVSLIVSDSGIGMDDKIKRQVFLPFFTTKDVGKGTGLGLAVVHGIVSSHGGTIKLESELGQGTTCEIKLPVANSER